MSWCPFRFLRVLRRWKRLGPGDWVRRDLRGTIRLRVQEIDDAAAKQKMPGLDRTMQGQDWYLL